MSKCKCDMCRAAEIANAVLDKLDLKDSRVASCLAIHMVVKAVLAAAPNDFLKTAIEINGRGSVQVMGESETLQ